MYGANRAAFRSEVNAENFRGDGALAIKIVEKGGDYTHILDDQYSIRIDLAPQKRHFQYVTYRMKPLRQCPRRDPVGLSREYRPFHDPRSNLKRHL